MLDNDYIDNDVKVRNHCHVAGKCWGSTRSDCNINVKINHKIHVAFQNLKNLIMQELDKFNLKINAIPNGLEKYMSFSTSNKFTFIW